MKYSFHCVPCCNNRFLHKSIGLEPSTNIIYDLEDSVSLITKNDARENLVRHIYTINNTSAINIRINKIASNEYFKDLNMIESLLKKCKVNFLVPKVNSRKEIEFVGQNLKQIEKKLNFELGSLLLEPIIESGKAVLNVGMILKSKRVNRIHLGLGDLAADLGLGGLEIGSSYEVGSELIKFCKLYTVLHCKSYGIQVVEGPYTGLDDPAKIKLECSKTLSLGFDGKWSIHPDQIPLIEDEFLAKYESIGIDDAIEIANMSTENSLGSKRYRGMMIDQATLEIANNILKRLNK